MHGAVAATEVVYYASRKLVASAMYYCRQQTTGPMGVAELAPLSVCFVVVVVVVVGNRQKNRE